MKVRLIDICQPKQWQTISTDKLLQHGYPVYGANGVIGYYDKYNHADPTVMITCRGATCGTVNISESFSYINGNAMSLDNLSKNVLINYLYYQLVNYDFKKVISGSAQPQITREGLSKVYIELHSLEEQKIIANNLEKINCLIEKRKQQLEKLDLLIKSKFNEMFDGLPSSDTLADYIQELRAGKSVTGSEECENKVLKTGAATFGFFDKNQVKNLPLDYVPNPLHMVESGDVIISRMNTPELVGTCSYVWEAPQKTYYPDRLWKTIVKPKVNAIFLWQLMQQKPVRKQIKEYASGTSGSMWNISKLNLLKIKVVNASTDQQNFFAHFVEQTDKSKRKIKQSLEKLETLKKALMQKYFG